MNKKEIKYTCQQNHYQMAWGWVLSQWQIATEFDIDGGYKGELGSLMCSHSLLISYSPFCGDNLESI